MIHTSKQLKDLIRNQAEKKKIEAHVLMRSYMMERLLERISLSQYKKSFILKGGMLISAMIGIDIRSTMDMDTNLQGLPLTIESVGTVFNEICAYPIEDGVQFTIKNIIEIMEEAEYGGIRVSLESLFDGIRTPMKVDISTGDIITPREIIFKMPLMLEDREISIWSYNLETVLAEKLETVITRSVTNTRMRDLYDLYILLKLQRDTINPALLKKAVNITATKRGTKAFLNNFNEVIIEIEQSDYQKKLWLAYRKKFQYAESIQWIDVMQAVQEIGRITDLLGDHD